MPCSVDHMMPNASEKLSKKLAKMVLHCHDRQVVSFDDTDLDLNTVIKAAHDFYGNTHISNDLARLLCASLKEADEDWIYDGRTRERRDLANWWDEHKSTDEAKVSISVQFQSYSELLNSRVNLRRSTLTSSGIPARMESSSEKCPGPQ